MNKSKLLLSLLLILIILITIIIVLCFINKSKFTEIPEFYNFYYEIDNVLTNEECDYIINDAIPPLLNPAAPLGVLEKFLLDSPVSLLKIVFRDV